MRLSIFLNSLHAAILVICGGWLSPVVAEDYSELLSEFDARQLTRSEKRFLQTSLAFEGHYQGLLDGDWGRMSQNAVEKYSRREFGTASQQWHMAMLAFDYIDIFESEGWRAKFFPSMGLSFLYPTKKVRVGESTEYFVNSNHTNSSLSYSLAVASKDRTQAFHNYTENRHANRKPIYKVRKTNFAVTSSIDRNGTILYTRSNYVNGAWSTVMISTTSADANILGAVSSSIAVGRPGSIELPENGVLLDTIFLALKYSEVSVVRVFGSRGCVI